MLPKNSHYFFLLHFKLCTKTEGFFPSRAAVPRARGIWRLTGAKAGRSWRPRELGTGVAAGGQPELKPLTLQFADAAGEALESPLPLLPPLQRGDHQFPSLLLPHHQVGDVDVVHLIAGTLEATFEPEHYLPQISFCQPIQLVDGFALCFRGDLGIPIDVGNLLHFYLQG